MYLYFENDAPHLKTIEGFCLNNLYLEFRHQVQNYAAHLEKGGGHESWAQVIDLQGVNRPDQALGFLFEVYVLKRDDFDSISTTEVEAFLQLSHSSLHDLLIFFREKRRFAVQGWAFVQQMVMKALNTLKDTKKHQSGTHQVELTAYPVHTEALRDFIFLASDIGLLFDKPVRVAIRQWLEQLYEDAVEDNTDVVSINPSRMNWYDPYVGLMNQLTEGGRVPNEFDCYAAVENQFVFVPESSLYEIIQHGFHFQRAIVPEVMPLLVLHPCDELAEKVLQVMYDDCKSLSVKGLNRLIGVRNWLPEARRAPLDVIIRQSKIHFAGQNPVAQNNQVEAKLVRLLASTVDGAGAQNIVALYKGHSESGHAGFRTFVGVVKENIGWVDLWTSPWTTRAECERIIRSFQKSVFTLEVHSDYLPVAIAQGLHWNLMSGFLPHPQLLNWVEVSNLGVVQPKNYSLTEVDELLDIEENYSPTPFQLKQALDASSKWMRQGRFASGWFESGDHVDDYLADFNFPKDQDILDDCVEQIFEPRRDLWIARFQWLAIWAHFNAKRRGPKVMDFLVMARLLESDLPMSHFHFFKDLAVATLSAYTYQQETEDD